VIGAENCCKQKVGLTTFFGRRGGVGGICILVKGERILWGEQKKSTSPTAQGMCNFTPKHYFSQNIDPFLQ